MERQRQREYDRGYIEERVAERAYDGQTILDL